MRNLLPSPLRSVWAFLGYVLFVGLPLGKFISLLGDVNFVMSYAVPILNAVNTWWGTLTLMVIGFGLLAWANHKQRMAADSAEPETELVNAGVPHVIPPEARSPNLSIDLIDWHLVYMASDQILEERQTDGTTTTKRRFLFFDPHDEGNVGLGAVNTAGWAVYILTADIINGTDEAITLRSVSIAFTRNGFVLFEDRPFDAKATVDAGGVSLEDLQTIQTGVRILDAGFRPWAKTEHIGPVSLPAHNSKRIRLTGYVFNRELNYLRGGCDEARLRAILGNGEPVDEHIATITTVPNQD